MSQSWHLWTHGINVVPELTKEFTGTDNGLFLRRYNTCAHVEQKKGTANWFHFGIPTGTKLYNDNANYHHAWLRVSVNNNAVINMVRVSQAYGPGAVTPNDLIEKWDNLNITGQNKEFDFDLPDKRCKGPLVMSVHVDFNEDGGMVEFAAAGVNFAELD